MDVVVIGGGGTVGSTVAYTLSVQIPATNVTLVDTDIDAAEGHAIDIRHSMCHATYGLGRPDFASEPLGSVHVAEPSPSVVSESDCLVVTASAPRPKDGDARGGRLTFLERNLEIVDNIAAWLNEADPTPVIVVSNPVDRITHRLWRQTGWPRQRFLGYSLSETARIADEIARQTDASPREVYCPILGEHGEHIVPIFSRATVSGEPVNFSESERDDIVEYVRDVPYDVLKLRGAQDSSRWVTARGVASVVQRLDDDCADALVCLSTPLEGEYGFKDVSLSVPVRLDKDGVANIVEWSLVEEERTALEDAYRVVRTST
ncbi:malate dehydrogenase [Halalkalicoccus jeotgali]|uniref:malate dehydrogenase n=1 Tax=Halalkalicoccus jeotgali (strain DSM 18796 / CECT 7217 / JCM 14584 / KCTC 4019 / B3) TaxID=795797 RepID=D8JCX5_HALJB|nr:lactate dehydrogenase [Halalkalicoccus jeotgali]ADJ16870.1 L-lactate dehydrogenase [Halalkalicoccus jeotgali B3]ELY38694.1 L-lactate dehydrogenase [Halalkalicoccus jeotgali B3]